MQICYYYLVQNVYSLKDPACRIHLCHPIFEEENTAISSFLWEKMTPNDIQMIALHVSSKEVDLKTVSGQQSLFHFQFLLAGCWQHFRSHTSGDCLTQARTWVVWVSVHAEVLRMLRSALPWASCTAGFPQQNSQRFLPYCCSQPGSEASGVQKPGMANT